MKRFFKISFVIILCLAVLLAVAVTFTIGWRPFIGRARAPDESCVRTYFPALGARQIPGGNEAAFVDCHSPHDLQSMSH